MLQAWSVLTWYTIIRSKLACFWKRKPQVLKMNTTKPLTSHSNLTVTHVLAELLERLEHSAVPVGAEQYRTVVQHLASELKEIQPGKALGALLDTHPAASELYENVNYQHAGLCRSTLETSLDAERQAREAINKAMNRTTINHLPTHLKEDPNHGKS